MLDLERILRRYRIPTAPEGDRHNRRGWIHLRCPFCRGAKNHLGWSLDRGFFSCFSCGWHPVDETLSRLLKIPRGEIKGILREFGGRIPRESVGKERGIRDQIPLEKSVLASLGPLHRGYLEDRGFDPDQIREIWGIGGTGPFSRYPWRIIAPIRIEGEMVGWQGRTISPRAEPKYLLSPGIRRDRILYGLDLILPGSPVVVVEGITDAWRIGPGAVATLGIEWSLAQVSLLKSHVEANRIPEVCVLFDPEDRARERGEGLARSLESLGIRSSILDSPSMVGDPADLQEDQVLDLWNHIRGRGDQIEYD